MAGLNERQKRFCQEYLIDLNATKAAIRAGYSEKTAYSQGQRLLKHPEGQKLIQKLKDKRAERTDVTLDNVVNELAKIGFANMEDYIQITSEGDAFVDLSNMTRDQAAAVSEITVEDFTNGRGEDTRNVRKVKFKLADKKTALVELGKHLGGFASKVDHTSSDGSMSPQNMTEDQVTERLEVLMARAAGMNAKTVVH